MCCNGVKPLMEGSMFASKLKKGDEIRIVSPATSMSVLSNETKMLAKTA